MPDVRLFGLGGSRMAAEGVGLLADLNRLAVLGFAEVVRHLPDLLRLRREVRRFLVSEGVDLLVPIDYPGFNLPLARFAHREGIRVLYYISPQVWAWHQSRARRLAEDADLVCVVLPFEKDLLERWGVPVRFVGHPLLDRPAEPRKPGSSLAPSLGLFPGSRRQEVEHLLPVFLEAARLLQAEVPGLDISIARAADLDEHVYGDTRGVKLADVDRVARQATAAITKSGTITLQLALAGVPMVVGYRVNPLTYLLARRLVRVEHIALVNLVAGRGVVPELVQHEVRPRALAAAVRPLLDVHASRRGEQIHALAEVVRRLGRPGAAARVAAECERLLTGDP